MEVQAYQWIYTMSSNPKRKRHIWFDDDNSWKDDGYSKDNYSEDMFEEERDIKFRSNREMQNRRIKTND